MNLLEDVARLDLYSHIIAVIKRLDYIVCRIDFPHDHIRIAKFGGNG